MIPRAFIFRFCAASVFLSTFVSFSFRSIGREEQNSPENEKLTSGYIVSTPAYTNALLTAILPYVTDFAARLDLAIPQRLTTNDVAIFAADRQISADRRAEGEPIVSRGVGGRLLLRNGMLFGFDAGHVIEFETAAVRDRTKNPPAQKINYDASQVIAIARGKIQALGYEPGILDADLQPTVQKPATIYGRLHPIYYIRWKRANSDTLTAEAWINGETGVLERLWLLGLPTAPPPNLAVKPAIQPESGGIRDFSGPEREALCVELLPEINELAKKLELPVGFPISRASIRSISAYGEIRDNRARRVNIVLTNGYSFGGDDGPHIHSFATPDAFFGQPFVRSGNLVGKWKFSKRAAIKLARQFIKKADVDKSGFCATHSPETQKPFVVGRPVIPRYQFTWDWQAYFVQVEVDAEKGRVTQISFGRADYILDAASRVAAQSRVTTYVDRASEFAL
jgi:hypothetical protein